MFFRRRKSQTATLPVTPETAPAPALPASAVVKSANTDSRVILQPYLTEKSSRLAELRQYTFLVVPGAEKTQIAREVARRYGVHPTHVTIVRLPGKIVRYGRTQGRRSAVKKAVVTLRSGEKIPFGVKT